MNPSFLKLCLVTHPEYQCKPDYEQRILQAVHAGVTMVQLRSKAISFDKIEKLAKNLLPLLQAKKIPLLINDQVMLAKTLDLDGVHLGQSDMHPTQAREILGTNKLIGWSIETMDELLEANELTCIDYIAASAVFPSKTKQNCKTIWELEGLKRIVQQSKHPVIAIGGINAQNTPSVMACGAAGIAVVGALHHDLNPANATRELLHAVQQGIHYAQSY